MHSCRISRADAETPEERFGRVLRELRRNRAISQEKLAFNSGYHPTYISQLERGKKSPSLRTIISLADALRSSASEILKRVEVDSDPAAGSLIANSLIATLSNETLLQPTSELQSEAHRGSVNTEPPEDDESQGDLS
jgi:transcriptional regulator with XRE-family HTH domain